MEYDIEIMNCWELTSLLFLDKPRQFYDRSYRLRNDSHDRASELQRGMEEMTVINELAFPTFRRYPPQ